MYLFGEGERLGQGFTVWKILNVNHDSWFIQLSFILSSVFSISFSYQFVTSNSLLFFFFLLPFIEHRTDIFMERILITSRWLLLLCQSTILHFCCHFCFSFVHHFTFFYTEFNLSFFIPISLIDVCHNFFSQSVFLLLWIYIVLKVIFPSSLKEDCSGSIKKTWRSVSLSLATSRILKGPLTLTIINYFKSVLLFLY